MKQLRDQRVLVTGGTSAIGRAIVERLSAEGAWVVFTGRDAERGPRSRRRPTRRSSRPTCASRTRSSSAIRKAAEVFDGLEGLVLGTGVLHEARISRPSDAAWDAVLETNLMAPFRFAAPACRSCGPPRAARSWRSPPGPRCGPRWRSAPTRSPSAALLWLAQMLAVEGAPDGVRVNAVCPGDVGSGMGAFVKVAAPPDQRLRAHATRTGWIATPADVAGAVAFFLVAPDASFSTGTSLTVDGGMRAALRAEQGARDRAALS